MGQRYRTYNFQAKNNRTNNNRSVKRIVAIVFAALVVINLVAIVGAVLYSERGGSLSFGGASDTNIVSLDEPVNTANYGFIRKSVNKVKAIGVLSNSSNKDASAQMANGDEEKADFEITMLDVGQGLSLLIRADDKYMLYDGGGPLSSSYVVSYLKKHGVTKISAMFVSHYDEDHIAGLIGVLNTIPVSNVVCPYYEGDTRIYNSFKEKLIASSANVVNPTGGDKFSLGNCVIEVLNPRDNKEYEDNNSSIVIKITCGNYRCMITGDAEEQVEKQILSYGYGVGAELLVVGHHGSSDSSCSEFISYVSPKYAFISCGKDNSYGHPAQETLNTLKANNVKIFRSDLQGEVTCFVNKDEGKYWFSKNPYANYEQSGVVAAVSKSIGNTNKSTNNAVNNTTTATTRANVTQQAAQQSGVQKYIVNINTGKFHYPSCSSVDQMAEHNKKPVTATRDELIRQGYSPCKRCKP